MNTKSDEDSLNDTVAIVLAAGLGKRLKSNLPKALHRANGRPLLHHVLRALQEVAEVGRVIVVVGKGKDEVIDYVDRHFEGVTFVEQPEQLGTGDAVKRTQQELADHEGTILVLPGDGPLIKAATIERLLHEHEKTEADVSLLTANLDNPRGYGRILRTEQGNFDRIVEEADAGPAEQAINEVSSGIFCFRAQGLFAALEKVTTDNAQGEYYLPDAALVIRAEGGKMYTVTADDGNEIRGVNDRSELADVSRQLRLEYLEKLASNGVTIEDPLTTYIDEGVEVGPDTVIRPLTFIEGSSRIGSGCQIGPNTRIADSIVDDRAEVTFSVIRESHIGAEATVGPFASLRPGTRLGPRAKAGTFVEIKGSIIGEGSKVPHQSYVGDAEIGKDVNLGAGTITGNYDNETKIKSKTVIEDGAFTGSNTTLVAPVTVAKDAGTGAGSVVTKDVDPEDIVAGVPARKMRKRKPRPRDNKK
ncbi:MAG: bifunctional UDP-N-acetylglucosamine diphosphorylase/glucosamine-1-phosphate N-acetyltransferase GlmU [Actinobacteria bacterium]|nr:bifunctional UDP-N-acetylglucosamine diphosphorylase/glucosamine-1-phosphate N-acetyltransferase GlmU [Actinomycetota bacterium]